METSVDAMWKKLSGEWQLRWEVLKHSFKILKASISF